MSLLPKEHREAIKELLSKTAEDDPRLLPRRVYYYPSAHDDAASYWSDPDFIENVNDLQQQNFLPWPDRHSWIVHPSPMDDSSSPLICINPWPHSAEHSALAEFPWIDAADGMDTIWYGLNDRKEWQSPMRERMFHLIDILGDEMPTSSTVVPFMNALFPKGPPFWGLREVELHAGRNGGSIEGALWVLAALTNSLYPCGYQIKIANHSQFIHKKHRPRNYTCEIIGMFSYDRVYRGCPNPPKGPGSGIRLKDRRGHYRHFWLESGINRFLLPRCYRDRRALAKELHVRKIWIYARWLGPSEWDAGGDHYSIMPGHFKEIAHEEDGEDFDERPSCP